MTNRESVCTGCAYDKAIGVQEKRSDAAHEQGGELRQRIYALMPENIRHLLIRILEK